MGRAQQLQQQEAYLAQVAQQQAQVAQQQHQHQHQHQQQQAAQRAQEQAQRTGQLAQENAQRTRQEDELRMLVEMGLQAAPYGSGASPPYGSGASLGASPPYGTGASLGGSPGGSPGFSPTSFRSITEAQSFVAPNLDLNSLAQTAPRASLDPLLRFTAAQAQTWQSPPGAM